MDIFLLTPSGTITWWRSKTVASGTSSITFAFKNRNLHYEGMFLTGTHHNASHMEMTKNNTTFHRRFLDARMVFSYLIATEETHNETLDREAYLPMLHKRPATGDYCAQIHIRPDINPESSTGAVIAALSIRGLWTQMYDSFLGALR